MKIWLSFGKRNEMRNSKKNTFSFSKIQKLTKAVPNYPNLSTDKSGHFVRFGDDNNFPENLLNLNAKSATNQAIINTKVKYIIGKGLKTDKYLGKPNPYDDWTDFLTNLAIDYVTFGQFAFQVVPNAELGYVSLYHQPISEVRVGEYDEFGNPLSYWISKDWTNTKGKFKPVEIEALGSNYIEKDKPQLFFYKDYNPSFSFYGLPSYYSAINWIEADGFLSEYVANSINNGFTASAIVTMPYSPSEGEKEEFQREIEANFGGTNGASAIMTIWSESPDLAPKIESFSTSANVDIYNNVSDIITQKIITSHSLTSPTLAGLSGRGTLGGNGNEIMNAYLLFKNTIILPMRKKLMESITPFVINNGYSKEDFVIVDMPLIEEFKDLNATVTEEKENNEETNVEENENI